VSVFNNGSGGISYDAGDCSGGDALRSDYAVREVSNDERKAKKNESTRHFRQWHAVLREPVIAESSAIRSGNRGANVIVALASLWFYAASASCSTSLLACCQKECAFDSPHAKHRFDL
jgi:hypothetical protein